MKRQQIQLLLKQKKCSDFVVGEMVDYREFRERNNGEGEGDGGLEEASYRRLEIE